MSLPDVLWCNRAPIEVCGDAANPPSGPATGASAMVFGVRPARDSGGPVVAAHARSVGRVFGVDLDRRMARAKVSGQAGDVVVIDLEGAGGTLEQLVLVGLGRQGPADTRRAGAALARRLGGHDRVAFALTDAMSADRIEALAQGWLLGAYRFSLKSAAPEPTTSSVVLFHKGQEPIASAAGPPDAVQRAVVAAWATARAVYRARDWANAPSNRKSPAQLVAEARAVSSVGGLECRVWDEQALVAGGFGGILAVGQGSMQAPAMVQLTYVPPGVSPTTPHVVLVGKGITFDSGGLSLKPPDFMTTMKTDMAGAAAVLATMSAVGDLGVRVRVTALLALAENMPSATAFRPGDVIQHFGGTTSEVFNTDAEGRLVLADALAYADAELDPDVVVDVATLTGAASVGLGRHHAALYATQDALVRAFVAAGKSSGDQVWPMPLVDEYLPALDSQIADVSHVERTRAYGAGSITAALFLRRFAGARPWVHLDIAGPGRSDSDRFEISRGGTGFGTRLLLKWLTGLS